MHLPISGAGSITGYLGPIALFNLLRTAGQSAAQHLSRERVNTEAAAQAIDVSPVRMGEKKVDLLL